MRRALFLSIPLGCAAPRASSTPATAPKTTAMAPAPFTVEELRAGNPRGHLVKERIVDHGETSYAVVHFIDADDEGATLRVSVLRADEQPTGEPQEVRVTWADPQAHGVFPADATTIEAGTVVDLHGDPVEAKIYSVRRSTPAGPTTRTLWFALDHPGGPTRSEERAGSDVVVTSQIVERRDRLRPSVAPKPEGCVGPAEVDCAVMAGVWALIERLADAIEASGGRCGIDGIQPNSPVILERGAARIYLLERETPPVCEFVVQVRERGRVIERAGLTDAEGWVQLAPGWYIGAATEDPPPQHLGARPLDAWP